MHIHATNKKNSLLRKKIRKNNFASDFSDFKKCCEIEMKTYVEKKIFLSIAIWWQKSNIEINILYTKTLIEIYLTNTI